LQEWSPFWECICITVKKEFDMFTILCRHAHSV